MKQLNNLEKLKDFTIFDRETIGQITGLEGQVLNNTITRWTENEEIVRLKKGIYTTQSFFDTNKSSAKYIEFVSNKLRYPSYVSLEYVLSQYQVLSESVFSITAVTTKVTRNYTNKLGRFTYRSIKKELFDGYVIKQSGEFDIAIATKAKSLFDYLYFTLLRSQVVDIRAISDLRLNLDSFTNEDIDEFEQFCYKSHIKKFEELTKVLFN